MTIVNVPYRYSGFKLEIPDDNFYGVAWPRGVPGSKYWSFEVGRAIRNSDVELLQIINRANSVLFIVDERIPPYVLNGIVDALKDVANLSSDKIKFLLAEDLIDVLPFWKEPLGKYKATLKLREGLLLDRLHGDYISIGKTKYGTPVNIDGTVMNFDTKILVNVVAVHDYAGYSGGGETLVPGISNFSTFKYQIEKALENECVAAGVMEMNPVRKDLEEIAKLIQIDYSINLVFNYRGELVKVYAGDYKRAYSAATKFVDRIHTTRIGAEPEIIIMSAGGYQSDRSLSLAFRALVYSRIILEKSEDIIFFADAREGIGDDIIISCIKDDQECREMYPELEDVYMLYRILRAQIIAKIIEKVDFHLFTRNREIIKKFIDTPIHIIEEPQRLLDRILRDNPEAKVLVIPYGDETVVLPESLK